MFMNCSAVISHPENVANTDRQEVCCFHRNLRYFFKRTLTKPRVLPSDLAENYSEVLSAYVFFLSPVSVIFDFLAVVAKIVLLSFMVALRTAVYLIQQTFKINYIFMIWTDACFKQW